MIGVNADHFQLTRYPHRGDEEFFDEFMSTLSDLVDEICPEFNRPDFLRSHDGEEAPDDWADLAELGASTASLSIESGKRSFALDLSIRVSSSRRSRHAPLHVTLGV